MLRTTSLMASTRLLFWLRNKALLELVDIDCPAQFRMARYAGRSDRLVVCLSGVGKKRDVMPPFEMINAATNKGRHSALFVSDQSRSWLNAPELAERIIAQIEVAQKLFKPKKTSAVGNSMGGFMALELSRHVELTTTLAITPQYSVMAREVPEETRWQFFRKQIESFRFPRVENLPTEGCTHYVLHGGTEDEFAHWRHFPVQKNLKHMILPGQDDDIVVLPGQDHNVAQTLRDKGLLKDVVQFAIENRFNALRQLLEKVGGKMRADLRLSDLSNISKEALL